MDILHLVDRLEELFNESKSLPLTHKVLVDEERMLDLIDQMRLAIPEEIKNSQQIINQKERVIAQANEEARRTVELAKEQGAKLLERDAIVQNAEIAANNIIQKAREETLTIKNEADDYAVNSLGHLEVELNKILMQVRNGINTLKSDIQSGQTVSEENPQRSSSNHEEQSE